jgi:NADPH-dependent 2,4-dienoyl-CoA reductase/sulfur reductase-like enzyme/rhodanese-related sulfurtransferase
LSAASAQRILVIGASAAGLKAAARAKRLLPAARVTVIDERSFISYGACGLPYYLSGDIDNLDALRQTPYGVLRDETFFARAKGVEVLTRLRAERIVPDRMVVEAVNLENQERLTLAFDELVIATGTSARCLPGVQPSDGVSTFRTPEEARALREGLQTGRIGEVVIIGAGFIGCELAGAFRELWGCEVALVEAEDRVLPQLLDQDMAGLVTAQLRRNGVRILTGAAVTAIAADDGKVRVDAGGQALPADRVVIAIGVAPRADLARDAGISIGPSGGLRVGERLETNRPHIYAAGDCIEVVHRVTGRPGLVPLGSLANRQGRVVGDNLAGKATRFGPVVGSAVVKIFDWNVAAVGLSETWARREGLQAHAALGTFLDSAHYYPEHKRLYLKLVYERESHRLLGLQAVGAGEVAKRADVFASLLHRQGRLEDLLDLEFCYSPPYNAALDPLHGLGCVALNQEETGVPGLGPLAPREGRHIIDVRLAEEITDEYPSLPGAVNIPLLELRGRVAELPRDKPLLIACAYGTRSYEVARWLVSEGFQDVAYLAGGAMMQAAL